MEYKLEVTIDATGEHATIRFPDSMTVDAGGALGLVDMAGKVRASLKPEVPAEPKLAALVPAVPAPRFWVGKEPMLGGVMLAFRHPGYGWLYFQIPHPEALHLRELLSEYSSPPEVPSGPAN